MAYKVKNKQKEKELSSEADVFNEIEERVRNNKPVSDREIRLLVEGYTAFGVPVPKDIQRKFKQRGFY